MIDTPEEIIKKMAEAIRTNECGADDYYHEAKAAYAIVQDHIKELEADHKETREVSFNRGALLDDRNEQIQALQAEIDRLRRD